MPVWVGEIAAIAAPECLGRRLKNACAGGFGPRHHRIDRILARQILRDDDAALRENRLRLLNRIRATTLTVADFSKIEG